MSPTRRDVIRSIAGVAVALPVAAIAVPATVQAEPQTVRAAAEWGAAEWGAYFAESMETRFPSYRDLSVKMVSENMVSMDGEHTRVGLSMSENGETCLFVMSPKPLDPSALKITLNGLALAFAAE